MIKKTAPSPASRLRAILNAPGLVQAPGCHDTLSARLLEQEGYPIAFVSQEAVAASATGRLDTETANPGTEARDIAARTDLPVLASMSGRPADASAVHGLSGVIVPEDTVSLASVLRSSGRDLVIVASVPHGGDIDATVKRASRSRDRGADACLVTGLETADAMRTIVAAVTGPHLVSLVEGEATPVLPPAELEAIGYSVALYPMTLLSSITRTMITALRHFKGGKHPTTLMGLPELKRRLGTEQA